MALQTNTAEGGTNGTTVTTGNSGGASGTAWNTVSPGSAGEITYTSTTPAHGSLCYSQSNVTGSTFVAWTGYNTATVAGRFYFQFPTLPASAQVIVRLRTASANMLTISLTVGNKVRVQDAALATIYTSTNSIVAGTWYRVEFAATPSATAATINVDWYVLDSTTPVETGLALTTGNTGVANFAEIRYGPQTSGGGFVPLFDDLAFDDTTTTYIGPVAGAAASGAAVAPTFTIASAGVVGKVGGAAVAPTATIAAAGTVGTSSGAAVAPTVTVAASGAVGTSSGAAVAPTVTVAASGAVGASSGAARPVTVTITSGGVVGASSGAAVSPSVTIATSGVVGAAQGAAVSVSIGIVASGHVHSDIVAVDVVVSIDVDAEQWAVDGNRGSPWAVDRIVLPRWLLQSRPDLWVIR